MNTIERRTKLVLLVRTITQAHIDGVLSWRACASLIGELLVEIENEFGKHARSYAFQVHLNMLPDGYYVG